jgi:hypothetical protein
MQWIGDKKRFVSAKRLGIVIALLAITFLFLVLMFGRG